MCTGVSEHARASQVWIDPLEIRIRIDLRQRLRTHLNNYAFGSFDLLLCVEKGRITLQRRQNGLVQGKGRHSASRHCFAADMFPRCRQNRADQESRTLQ